MTKRKLSLVRHGQYNLRLREQGELTPMGEAQSRLTAQALKGTSFNRIYVSTVLRAVQTAAIIGECFPTLTPQPTDLLRECLPPVPQRLVSAFAMHVPGFSSQDTSQCVDQFARAFDHFFAPPTPGRTNGTSGDTHDLIVCHGNIIRYFVAAALKTNVEMWTNLMIHNCGITRMMVDEDGEIYLVSHNDIGHLPQELRTDN